MSGRAERRGRRSAASAGGCRRFGARRRLRRRSPEVPRVAVLLSALLIGTFLTAFSVYPADAQTFGIQPNASCAVLAGRDPSATNTGWGRTSLPGHNAPGGWFGVDVCANGSNTVAP